MTYCTTGKRIWLSRDAAKRHAGRVHHHRMRAYFCTECRAWHLANEEKR